jgi:hypothetical protein
LETDLVKIIRSVVNFALLTFRQSHHVRHEKQAHRRVQFSAVTRTLQSTRLFFDGSPRRTFGNG